MGEIALEQPDLATEMIDTARWNLTPVKELLKAARDLPLSLQALLHAYIVNRVNAENLAGEKGATVNLIADLGANGINGYFVSRGMTSILPENDRFDRLLSKGFNRLRERI